MTGPSRTNGKMRPGPTGPKPPRPPNAWILYRSDKLRELAERRDPHAPKRLQADISKEISEMWKTEDPEVKREYERIADIKKQEHRTQYPNYKFQPVKKEDKARQREEERAEKARAKEELKKAKAQHVPYVQSYAVASSSRQSAHYMPPPSPYSDMGPSPPLSAASSPMCTPSPLSVDGDLPEEKPAPEFRPSPGFKPPGFQPAQFPAHSDVVMTPRDKPSRPKQQPGYDPRMPPPPVPAKVQQRLRKQQQPQQQQQRQPQQQQQQKPQLQAPQQAAPPPPSQPAPTPLTPESISPPSASAPQTIDLPMVDAPSASSSSAQPETPAIVVSPAENDSFRAQPDSEDVSMDGPGEAGPAAMDLELGFMDMSGMNGMNGMQMDGMNGMNGMNGMGDMPGLDGMTPSNQLELMPMDTDMLQLEMPLTDLVSFDWLQPQAGGEDAAGAGASTNATSVPGVFGLAPMQGADFNVFPPPSFDVAVDMMAGPLRTAPAEDVSLFTELLSGIDWANMPGGALFGTVQAEGEGEGAGAGQGADGMDMDPPPFDVGLMPRSVTQNELFQQFLNMSQMAEGEGEGNASMQNAQQQQQQQQQQQPQPTFEQPTAVAPHVLMVTHPTNVPAPPPPATPVPKYTPPRGAANFEKRRVAGSWKAAPRA